MTPWFPAIISLSVLFTGLFCRSVEAETARQAYALPEIVGLAIERNPLIAGAMARPYKR